MSRNLGGPFRPHVKIWHVAALGLSGALLTSAALTWMVPGSGQINDRDDRGNRTVDFNRATPAPGMPTPVPIPPAAKRVASPIPTPKVTPSVGSGITRDKRAPKQEIGSGLSRDKRAPKQEIGEGVFLPKRHHKGDSKS